MFLNLWLIGCGDQTEGTSGEHRIDSDLDMANARILADASIHADDGMGSEADVEVMDSDGDGVPDHLDHFPHDPDESADADGDGVGDMGDQFPNDPTESMDRDGDGIGDNADAFPDDPNAAYDSDGDGFPDATDQFPNDPTENIDTDLDGQGDNEDDDDDNDGLSDDEEREFGTDCARSSPLLRDTDGDGIDDPEDPYPLDPHPEFLVRQSDNGLIDLFLSQRDGSFAEAVEIGEPIEHEGRTLKYGRFSVGDFDSDGIMDFIAQSDPLVEDQLERNVYLFTRDIKADQFQRTFLGVYDRKLFGIVADVNADFRFDLVAVEIDRPNHVSGARVVTYLNNPNGRPGCVAGDSAQDGCIFIRLPDQDLADTVSGEWVVRHGFQAVNLNPQDDAHLDLTIVSYSSGGNAPSSVYVLDGHGDGTFSEPAVRLNHNARRDQAPANTVLFADFDNDGVGDVVMGFDDDGRPGEAWTYFGMGDGEFFERPVMSLDLNPNDAREQGGAEFLGREGSGRTFDFDFDGNADLIIGYHHVNYRGPAQTRLYRGLGNGTFDPEFSVIGPESMQRSLRHSSTAVLAV